MKRMTDELIALGKEYGVDVKITTPARPGGEIVVVPGIKFRSTGGEERKP